MRNPLNSRLPFRPLAGFDFFLVTFVRLCLCVDEKDEMASADSDKFCSIINRVESLHQLGKRDCAFVGLL